MPPAADGIERIVATPRANTRYEYERKLAKAHVQDLQCRIGPRPGLSLGCDFHLSYENLQNVLLEPARYTIEGGDYLLVELRVFPCSWISASRSLEIVALRR